VRTPPETGGVVAKDRGAAIGREELGFSDTFFPVLKSRGIRTPRHQLAKWLVIGFLPFQVTFKRFTKSKKM